MGKRTRFKLDCLMPREMGEGGKGSINVFTAGLSSNSMTAVTVLLGQG